MNILTTPFEKDLTDIPLADYPRPQLVRDSYLCLNGKWDIKIENGKKELFKGEILVPFPIESKLSGVGKTFPKEALYTYSRRFSLPAGFKNERIILNFGAVDCETQVYINGSFVGGNVGGYIPFSFDITDYLNDNDNIIRVEVTDFSDTTFPYGKQTEKRGGMWYTKVSGIWQTVWLESVPKSHITKIKAVNDENSVTLNVLGGENEKTVTVFTPQGEKSYDFSGDSIKIDIEKPVCWTPENPYIYRFTLKSGGDTVSSYFAIRTVSTKKVGDKTFIALNGKPYFFNGLLDQGYFSDGIFLPATYEGYKNDILVAKKLGFNMLRKHIKIEPQIFYYYCDIYGMVVFQDAVNNGKYSLFYDTALPTVGFKKLKKKAPNICRERFEKCAEEMLELLYNHPSVCYYTIFNEGWGQYEATPVYEKLKSLDNSRVYDTASGWFKGPQSDVVSEHVYFKPVKLKPSPDKPLILSEFGGYCYKILENSFNKEKTFGYKKCATSEILEQDLKRLYREEILPAVQMGLNATVLTQLSDVEDETNGLITYDRQIVKLSENSLAAEFKAIKEEFEKISK